MIASLCYFDWAPITKSSHLIQMEFLMNNELHKNVSIRKYIPIGILSYLCIHMLTKAEITTQFIIDTVAPVFNKFGYAGTSMSDITKATGLTKGAVYGNFENKEQLALEVFNFSVRRVIWKVSDRVKEQDSATDKLKAITRFYRQYYEMVIDFGGCPLLNVGVDTNNTMPVLHAQVLSVLKKLQNNIKAIFDLGIANGEFKPDLESKRLSARFVSQIQGAVFTSVMLKNHDHLIDMTDFIDHEIDATYSN
ncbi:MAG: TetR/AcrR family transcriptional repressor of nem operon [Litorivivens sp.]